MIRSALLLGMLAVACTVWAAPIPKEKKFVYVDFQALANVPLDGNFGGTENNHLKELPQGEQTFGEVKFKIDKKLIQLGSTIVKEPPEKVEGIKVDHKAKKIYFLHATQYGGGPNTEGNTGFCKDDTVIGEYRIQYEDKTTDPMKIVYGKDVRDWWFLEGEKDTTSGKIVWKGENPSATSFNSKIRLYMGTWTNPNPDKKVAFIDFISKKEETPCAPFCVAITLE